MDSEKEEELLSFLQSIGFSGKSLSRDIHTGIVDDAPFFYVGHRIEHGDEAMLFKLKFERDMQFDSYRLVRYEARHRDALAIDHKTIGGVDTRLLEARMKIEHWDAFFRPGGDPSLDGQAMGYILETIGMLDKLSDGQNFDGMKIQQELKFKYWPEHADDSPDRADMKWHYEQGQDFVASEFGICNAILAYYICSGRLETLIEQLEPIHLQDYMNWNPHLEVEKILSRDPGSFDIVCSANSTEGFAFFNADVFKNSEGYSVNPYKLIFTPYPEIVHGIYNGVDSSVLNFQMSGIDWTKPNGLIDLSDGNGPVYTASFLEIKRQLESLGKHEHGRKIADTLQLMHWNGTTYFNDMVSSSAWDYYQTLPKREDTFSCQTEVLVARNLLCGKPVLKRFLLKDANESADWIRLDLGKKHPGLGYALIDVQGYTEKDLEDTIKLLPLKQEQYYAILNQVKRGSLTPAELITGQKILLQAFPEEKTIRVFSPAREPIYTNLNFSPNWDPISGQRLEVGQRMEHKQKAADHFIKNKKKKKGKGI